MWLNYVLLKQPIAKLSRFKLQRVINSQSTIIRLKHHEDSNYALKYDVSQKIVVVEELPKQPIPPAEFHFTLMTPNWRPYCLETV